MSNQRVISLIVVFLSVCGCSRDPQKAKQEYFASGVRYAQKAQYPAAIVQFRNALKQDPKSVDTLNKLAEGYIANRQPREASAALMEAVAIDPNRTDVRLNLGRLYLDAGEFQKTEEQATAILERDPANASAQQVLGVSLASQGENEKAVAAFQKAVELSPKDVSSLVYLGTSLAAVGNREEAERAFQKAIEIDPRHVPAWLDFAAFLRSGGQLQRVEQVLGDGLQKNPDDLNLHLALADLFLEQGKAEPLNALLRSLRERRPKPEVALTLGDFFAARNQRERAASEYLWGARIAPTNLLMKARLVEHFLNSSNLRDAEKWNSEILRQQPKNVAAGIARGRILLAQGKRDEAIAELRRQVSQARDSVEAHYYLGLAYVRNLNNEQAKAEFRDAVRLDQRFLPARLSLAELQMHLGELAPARGIAEDTVRMYPKSATAQSLFGSVLLRSRDVAGAREHLLAARDLAPGDPSVLVLLGASYAAEGKWADAQHQYEAALKLDPNYAPALSQFSEVLVAKGESAKAIDLLRQHIQVRPDDAETHFTLGMLYRQKHDHPAAEAELSRAVQLAPDRIQLRLQLGDMYQDQGRVGAAIEQFEAALKIEPRSSLVHAMIGNARFTNGEIDLARKHFEQGLALDPNAAGLANNLAFVNAISGGNLDAALALAQKARELAPDVVNVADTLGWIQYKKGLYPGAVQLLEDCVRKAPESPVYRYHLGMAFMATGQRAKARANLEAALRLNLEGDDGTHARDALAKMR
jgi:tetratricopeptide (TPR) repeat protein